MPPLLAPIHKFCSFFRTSFSGTSCKKRKTAKIEYKKGFLSILIPFLAAAFVPSFVMVTLAVNSLQSIEKELFHTVEASFQNMIQELDGFFTDILQISYKLTSDNTIRSYALSGTKSTLTEAEISETLAREVLGTDFVDCACLYDPREGKNQITSSVTLDLTDFAKRYFDCGAETLAQAIDGVRESGFVRIPQKYSGEGDRYIFVRKLFPYNSSLKNAILLQISRENLTAWMQTMLLNESSYMLISGQDGLLASNADTETASAFSEYLQNTESGKILTNKIPVQNQAYFCQYYRSPLTGFLYAYAVPQESFQESSYLTVRYVLLMLGGACVFSLFICWKLAKKNYTRLKKILPAVSSAKQADGSIYSMLEEHVSKLANENKTLNSTVTKQAGELRESFLEKLLLGRIQYFDNISDLLRMHHIDCQYSYWSCILLDIKEETALFSEDNIDLSERQKLLYMILDNVFGELCEKIHVGYLVKMTDCYVCVVNSKDSSPHTEQQIAGVCTEVSAFLEQKFLLANETFRSTVYWGVENLSKAYEEVRTAWLKKSDEHNSQYSACISRCIELMKEKFSDNSLSIAQIAEQVGFNASYLSTYFKLHVGIGLLDYLQRYRILSAKKLLLETPYQSLSQIAEQTGFTSVPSLIRVFKKLEGTTPGEYRKQHVDR